LEKTDMILSIETSTNICSIALSKNGKLKFSRSNAEGMNHAALLSVFIEEAMNYINTHSERLDAVAVSSGPGSYTGLRIGVSTAKGLCYALDIPLIAVSTLETIAIPVIKNKLEENALYCPMIDARRMEVYSSFFSSKAECVRPVSADIISSESYAQLLNDHNIYFFGNGSEKCKEILTHPNALFIDNIVPLAENMIHLAENALKEKKHEDLAYFEPFYLKEWFNPRENEVPKN